MGGEATYDRLMRSWHDVKFIYIVVFKMRIRDGYEESVFTHIESTYTDPERAVAAIRATGYSESCFDIIVKELNRAVFHNNEEE